MDQVLSAALERTLAWAREHVPFYRRRLGRKTPFHALPLLTKAQAISAGDSLFARGTAPFAGVVSSGTQQRDGAVLRVPRTREEADALGPPPRPNGLVLEVRSAHHGFAHLRPRENWLTIPWSYTANAPRLLEELLTHGPGVTDLLINAGALMPWTTSLLARGLKPKTFRLRSISTTSFRLSPHWRAQVERTFGCPVFDNYSLSEIPGWALECKRCGFNHFGHPAPHVECVDPVTKKPAHGNQGVLVLTTLYPFVQAMPLIRYFTGDLVELGPRCPRTNSRGIRPLGRLFQSLVSREGILVAAQHLTDALEAEPLVARHPHPMEQLKLVSTTDSGGVKFRVSKDLIELELKFDPRAYPDAAQALGERVAQALLKKSNALRRYERLGRGTLELRLLGPGSLTGTFTKF